MYPENISVIWTLLEWSERELGGQKIFPTLKERMGLSIRLARANGVHNTNDPFRACIFVWKSGRIVSSGVNRVVSNFSSIDHAEAVAIAIAQRRCSIYDLADKHLSGIELVTSAQPCVQCFGMVCWSRVKYVMIGATDEDDERLTGLEEGPMPDVWIELLRNRPRSAIEVTQGIARERACSVQNIYLS